MGFSILFHEVHTKEIGNDNSCFARKNKVTNRVNLYSQHFFSDIGPGWFSELNEGPGKTKHGVNFRHSTNDILNYERK